MTDLWLEDFIAYDTETTGFGPEARIVELAVVRFSSGTVKEIFSGRFDPPDVDWSSDAVKGAVEIHGMTEESLKGCPTFGSHIDVILGYFKGCSVWVAHNAKFDQRLLQQEFNRWGRTFTVAEQHWSLCTLAIERKLARQTSGGNKLHEACARYGITLEHAHSAEDDTIACGQLLIAQLKSGRLPKRWMEVACPSRSVWPKL